MTVNISKPSINIREKLAELDKPSGIAGEAVLRADSVQDVRDSINAGRKNLIINGAMAVTQRGTSATGMAYGYHTADRWRSSYNGATSNTYPLVNEAILSSQLVDGSTVSVLKRTYPVQSDLGQHRLNYRVEISDILPHLGKVLTLSYYVKADKSLILDNSAFYIGGVGVSLSTEDVTTSWVRKTHTFTCPSTAGSNTFADLTIGSAAVNMSGANIYYTMLQLELGSTATDFEHRSYGEELALCQRYYQRFGGAAYVGIASGLSTHLTTSRFTFVNPVQMRTTPSLSFSSLIATDRTIYDLLITNFSGSVLGAASSYLTCTHQGNAIASKGAILAVRNGTTGYLAFSAEL